MRVPFPLLVIAATLLSGCAAASAPPPAGPPLRESGSREDAGTAPADDLVGRIATGVSYADLLRGVLDRNPAVAAARARWQAALEKHPQALTLPDPMLSFQYYTRVSMNPAAPQRVDAMLSQEIPFPAKIALQGDLALREAEMARLAYDMALRDAAAEARQALLELAYIDRAQEAVAATAEILARYATVAAGELAAGRTSLPEEIRARTLLAQSGYDRTLLEDLRRAEEQRIRGLLRLPPGAAVGPAAPVDFRPVAARLDDLYRLAEARSQELAMARVRLDMAGLEVAVARWEFAPDLQVGGLWMRNMEDAGGEFMGGRAFTFGLTVPIWVLAKSARVREAGALENAAGADREAVVEGIRTGAARLYFRAVNAGRLVLLYRDTLIPQAEKSLLLAETLFREGRGSLAGTLETALAWQNFQLAYRRALSDHGQAVAMLEMVIGASVTETPSPPSPEGGAR